MNCLEFKRLALSDPNSEDRDFVTHSRECPDCLKYIGGVRQMDADLAQSVDVKVPESLMARIQLNQLIEEETKRESWFSGLSAVNQYGMAACLAVALFVGGFMASNALQRDAIGADYQALLAGVIEHMDEVPVTPVWDVARANESVNVHLANYENGMKLKHLENLQFSRICPLGEYKGLHAGLDTPEGHVTFAYIKGEKVEDLLDAAYEGYSVRVKPLKEGNLIIVSKSHKGVQDAGKQLDEAVYWDI